MAWIIQDGQLINDEFINIGTKPFVGDSPYTMWRIDPNANGGMPFVPLMIGVAKLAPEPPIHIEPVPQKEYITVHDMFTPQNGFDNHGICVLDPIQCRVTEQLNGEYSAYLEHPFDEWGKWRYLLEMNFLKIMGQIFVIYKVNHSISGDTGTVKVWARHVFYLLNDRWIYSGSHLAAASGQLILDFSYGQADAKQREGDIKYDYTRRSDIGTVDPQSLQKWWSIPAGITFGEFILGSDGFIDTLGGELYRDNFYFSVNNTKEHSKNNAFEIRVGFNLKGINREIDLSQLCTYLTGKDNFGNAYAVATTGGSQTYPRHIVREVMFNYDTANMSQLIADTNEQFSQNNHPKTTYTVNLYDVRNNPDYSEITGFPDYTVGNTGYIYDERLARIIGSPRIEVRVNKTVIDGITGEVLEVQFGDKASITRPKQSKVKRLSKEQIEQLVNETQSMARTLGTWNSVYNYTWGELARFTWNQVNGSPT